MNRHHSVPTDDRSGSGAAATTFIGDVGRHPPRPRLALNVGITGHRAAILPDGATAALRDVLDLVFERLRSSAHRLHRSGSDLFDSDMPIIRLHTPLASGADQLAADSARVHGFHVRALLPFAPDIYVTDFEDGQELNEFSRQLEKADDFFALPGARADGDMAYVQVGKAVIAASDIMVAIWNGKAANGPGGTAHVVELALQDGVPVIHVEVDLNSARVADPFLLSGTDAINPISAPLRSAKAFDELVEDTLLPHSEFECEQIRTFYTERERRNNWRLEYPVLLSLMRVKSMASRPWKQSSVKADVEQHWKEVEDADPIGARMPLARAYGWANFLGIRYAQLFRSGHVTNYVLSVAAVMLALLGLLVPEVKFFLVIAELAVIGLLYFNTRAGRRGEWHRRWLQYRQLAESLRPRIYLKRTGVISTPFRTDVVRGALGRETGADWTRWYAAAIWREMDSPSGIFRKIDVCNLGGTVVREQIIPQASYHRVNADRMHLLDHRLHEIGNFLMGAVIAACILFIVGYVVIHEWVVANANVFIFLTAGLPAIGSAVFGLRGHGEHLLAASRSKQTAIALEKNADRLKDANRLDTLAPELETTASIMLADLDEWTLAYRERSLEIPA